jgi:hypothetical protein
VPVLAMRELARTGDEGDAAASPADGLLEASSDGG